MSQAAEANQSLFFVKYDIRKALIGAPDFQISLTVNTPSRTVNGSGRITQTTNPPLDLNTDLHGTYSYMTVMPDRSSILVVATGYPSIHWPPHGGVGPIIPPNVHLRMVLDDNWSSGTASYRYLDAQGQWVDVDDVPVRMS